MKKTLAIIILGLVFVGATVHADEGSDRVDSKTYSGNSRTECIEQVTAHRAEQFDAIYQLFRERIDARFEELQLQIETINERYKDLDATYDDYRELRKEQREALRDAHREYREFFREEARDKRDAESEVRRTSREAIRECRQR